MSNSNKTESRIRYLKQCNKNNLMNNLRILVKENPIVTGNFLAIRIQNIRNRLALLVISQAMQEIKNIS